MCRICPTQCLFYCKCQRCINLDCFSLLISQESTFKKEDEATVKKVPLVSVSDRTPTIHRYSKRLLSFIAIMSLYFSQFITLHAMLD